MSPELEDALVRLLGRLVEVADLLLVEIREEVEHEHSKREMAERRTEGGR